MAFGSRFGALRIGAAAAAAVVVAEAAIWLLAPGEAAIEPAEVSASSYFDSEQVERAQAYRGGQRALAFGAIAVSSALMLALSLGRPRFARRGLEALGRRPRSGAAAAGAAISALVAVATLPLAVVAHERAVDYGISTQGFGSWLLDEGKAAGIAAALTAAAAALLITLVRRLPRAWWIPAAGGIVVYAIVFSALAPVLLAPLFNDFDRLEPGPARNAVVELAERAGVEVGEVYEVDASRRSTALNAYVSGLGPTKRVVVYDNLFDSVERSALRSVLAHELAHAANRDIWRGIVFVALVALPGMLFVRLAGRALARRGGADPASPAALPAYGLSIAIAALVLGAAGNQLSRQIEASADAFALRLTEDPQGLIELQSRLAQRNLSDPDPPRWAHFLFGSHPTTLERIGAAEAFARSRSRE